MTRPSVYTPFLRRFSDERALDIAETKKLYDRVIAAHRSSVWGTHDAIERVSAQIAGSVAEIVKIPACLALTDALDRYQKDLLALETGIFTSASVDFSKPLSLQDQVQLARHLRTQEYFLAHDERLSEQLATAIGNVSGGVLQSVPPLAESALSAPLICVLPNPNDVVDRIIGTLSTRELAEAGLFTAVQDRIYENMCRYSGIRPGSNSNKPLVTAAEAKLSPEELVDTYLSGTPFHSFLLTPIPFCIPEAIRFEHTHIVGGSGAGKTTLIQQTILDNLALKDPPAMVIIDPKGLMVERISKLAIFNKRLKDRIIVIDPTKQPLPSLGLFDLPTGQSAARLRNKLVEFFEYIFSTSEAEITQRQSIPFRFVIRLILFMRGDLNTLMDVLEEKVKNAEQSRFASEISEFIATDNGARRFFINEFYSSGFSPTREQIRTRLYQIISSPILMRIFCARESRVNFLDCLQSRKIILINTGMNDFERKDSQLIGRYAISMTLAAAFCRPAFPREQWSPAYLFIDEFQEFADEQKTPELLRLAREYNLGVTIAHQNMYCDELNDSIRGAISTNTSIKYAAAVEALDLSYVARDLRCETDFLRSQIRDATHARFACFVRNLTNTAVSVSVPLINIRDDMQMSKPAYANLLQKNARRIAALEAPNALPTPSLATNEAILSEPPLQRDKSPSEPDTSESGSTW